MELGVDVNSCDNTCRTPLQVIQWDGNGVGLLLLEHGADPGVRDDDGQTPLHAASRSGCLKFAQRLLELGVDVNSRDNKGRTPLPMMLWNSHNVGLLLLEHGADPGIRDDDGQTPLHVASRKGNLSITQQLLKFDIDVNSHDHQGHTPFQMAVEGGHDEVEKLLLEHHQENIHLLVYLST